MTYKHYIIFANYSLSQLRLDSFLHSNREKLAKNGLQWQSSFNKLWQTHALNNLSAQYSALWRYRHQISDKDRFYKTKSIINSKLKQLAASANPSGDLLWLMGPLHNESMLVLAEDLKKYPEFANKEIVPIIFGERQDKIVDDRTRFLWKNSNYEILTQEMLSLGAFVNYAKTFEILNSVLSDGKANFILADFNVSIKDIIRMLKLPLEMLELAPTEELYPFPQSYAGLAMATAAFSFPFSKNNEFCYDKRSFLKTLCEVENAQQFPIARGISSSAVSYLERFKESNHALASMLHVNQLFLQDAYDLYPDPPPELEYEQAAYFVRAISPDLRHAFLRYFRDRKDRFLKEELTFATALENYRKKMEPVYGFTFPRPKPVLSVLTMTRNHKKFITECMESVSAQKTDFPIEHIIVDDASDDGNQDIIDNYAATHPHVRPIYLPCRSTGGQNIRTLFETCDSEFAALCDGDDYFSEPHKLQKQVAFLSKNQDCALCFHPVMAVYENNAAPSFIYPQADLLPRGLREKYYLSDIIKSNFIQTNSVVYRWRFRDGLPAWFRSDLCPSDWYWHILHAENGKIGFIPEVMSIYRRHPASYYATSFTDSSVNHRRAHGMAELKVYAAINEHFNNRYFRPLSDLANGVMSDFLRIMMENDDSALLDEAVEKYPEFARKFLKEIRILNKLDATRR